jgi:very-short-patch-repair endonuclease
MNQTMKACKENHFLYNPNLKKRARNMRSKGTKAEAYLWKFILQKSIMGYKFQRQRPVMNYIADFMCKELMLIIETDGATHLLNGAKEKDEKRRLELEQVGFTVICFEDGVVLNNIGWVTSIIEQEINKIKKTRE